MGKDFQEACGRKKEQWLKGKPQSPFHTVKIRSKNNSGIPTFVWIDGFQVHGVTAIEYDVGVSKIPEIRLTMLGAVDLEIVGNVVKRIHNPAKKL